MGLLRLPIFLFVCFKGGFARLKITKDQPDLIILLSIALTTITMPFLGALYLLLASVKFLIDLRLRQKYQENYRGLMEGIDTLCCSQENCVPNVITFVHFKGRAEDLAESVVQQLKRTMLTRHEKLFYCRGSFLGYHFYYRKPISAEQYVRILDFGDAGVSTKKDLSSSLVGFYNEPLPEGDAALFDVLIVPKPVLRSNAYCLIYRFHHCIGDGRSILHLFKGVLADHHDQLQHSPVINGHRPRISDKEEFASKLKRFLHEVEIKDFPMSVRDRNILRGTSLSEDKYLAWFSDGGTGCMEKIRSLRKSVSGLTFLDVMNTCLSSSLYDYYKKKGGPVPRSIIGGVVLSPETVSYTSYGIQDFNLVNRFSAASFNLPIDVGVEGQLSTRLRMVKKEYDLVKKCFDIHFNYWVTQNLLHKLPVPVISWMSGFLEITIGISSLPGCEEFTLFGGCGVEDFLLMPPNSPGTGLHVVIYTYGGRLRICLTADSSIVGSYDDAQEIVDRTIEYLKELEAADVQKGW